MYYKFSSWSAGNPLDCVGDTDRDYKTEAAAYEHLRAKDPEHKDSFAPEYYGSWSLDLPITIRGEPHIRTVYLVLIELLNGTSIENMRVQNSPQGETDSFHYPEEYRLEVLARAMEGYARQLDGG